MKKPGFVMDAVRKYMQQSIEQHQPDYKEGAWKDYTLSELGWWVHLFVKRSAHRKNADKKTKDLHDAQNYLNMMQSHINAAK